MWMQSFHTLRRKRKAAKSFASSATVDSGESTGNCWSGWGGGEVASLNRPFVFHLGLQRGRPALTCMANILRLVEVDHFFGDIGGVVADAFQTFGDDH